MTDHTPAPQALSSRQIQLVSAMVAGSFALSGALGVIRQAVIGGTFGAGPLLDAFYAAYRIPELLFALVAGGALGSAFIPIYSRFLSKGEHENAWRLASAMLSLVVLIGLLLSMLGVLFSDWIAATLLIPDAGVAQQALTADLMRIMLWTVAIFGASGLVMGLLNANQRFLAPALAPSMNNIGLIIGALLLAPALGVYGLAWGALLAAVLHLGIQLPALRALHPRLRLRLQAAGVNEALRLMLPRLIGQGAVQINFVVNTALASGMLPGSLTALVVAFNLMFVVLGVLGQSVGTAIFPTLALFGAQEDYTGFRRTLSEAMRGVLFLAIPASVGLLVLAAPLIAVIYERGRWSPADTQAAAWALRFFALGLAAFGLQEVLARAFFALRDTVTPVAIAVAGMLLNVLLSLALIRVVRGEMPLFGPPVDPLTTLQLWTPPPGEGPFGGLALANSLATMVESLALWLLLRRRLTSLRDREILLGTLRVLAASVVMGAAVWWVARQLAPQPPLIVLLAGTGSGLVVFEIAALALGLPEARRIPSALLHRVRARAS